MKHKSELVAASFLHRARAVIWDSDNTIIDVPWSYLLPRIHAHQARLGLRQLTDDEAKGVWRGHNSERFKELTGASDDIEWYAGFNQNNNLEERAQAVTAYPGVVKVIRRLQSLDKKQQVLTNTETAIATVQLRRVGLDDLPMLALAGPPQLPRKPDRFGLDYVLRELGVEPAEAVMVGDSNGDSQMAEAVGVPFLWWCDDGHHCSVSAEIAVAHIRSYETLVALL